ncbi:hypothetical protein KEM54_002184 [Ascosphaera aggregata]|nr:hypothetical protein KEM54_002184 [Ascosphaera aggregata]
MPYLVCAGQQEVVLSWLSDIADDTDLHARWVLQSRKEEKEGEAGAGVEKEMNKKKKEKEKKEKKEEEEEEFRSIANDMSRLLLAPKRSDCVLNVLIELLAAELRYLKDLAAAINHLSRVCVMFASAGCSSASSTLSSSSSDAGMILNNFKTEDYRTSVPIRTRTSPFRRAAIYIATYISDHNRTSQVVNLPSKSYDRFQSTLTLLIGEDHFWSSLIPLYHPQNPTAASALRYGKHRFERYHSFRPSTTPTPSPFSNGSSEPRNAVGYDIMKNRSRQPVPSPSPSPSPPTSRQRHYLLRMCLQAAQVCLGQKQHAQAEWFLIHAKVFLDPVGSGSFAEEDRGCEVRSYASERRRGGGGGGGKKDGKGYEKCSAFDGLSTGMFLGQV